MKERAAVRDAVLRMNHFPVGMEQFGAADEKQWKIISDLIDTSDYYVLIIGNRYGSIIPNLNDDVYAGMSYTEKEMRYADEKGVPILAFLPDKSVPIQQGQLENDDKRKKLECFKDYVKNRSTVGFWNNADNLASLVVSSLYMEFGRAERLGWIRGADVQSSLDTINDLSRKVHELEIENKELRSFAKTEKRSPKLVVSISCSETVEKAEDKYRKWNNSDVSAMKYEMTDNSLIIHMKRIPEKGYIGNTDTLSMDDVPDELKEYVSLNQLNEYNDNLPSQEEINIYNSNMLYYKTIKENGIILKIRISNDGTEKATNICVDLDFAEQFVTCDKEDAIDLTAPHYPKMPRNPIIEAKKNLEKKTVINEDFLNGYVSTFGSMNIGFDNIAPSLPHPPNLANTIRKLSGHWSVNARKQHVSVWKDSLMHKYEWNQAEFCVAPMEPGEYLVKISALCEEISEPILTEYKIIVVED